MSLAVSFHVERHFNERVGTTSCTLVGIVPSAKFLANEFGVFDLKSTRETGWKVPVVTSLWRQAWADAIFQERQICLKGVWRQAPQEGWACWALPAHPQQPLPSLLPAPGENPRSTACASLSYGGPPRFSRRCVSSMCSPGLAWK